MVKKIPLTRGQYALVDDEDFEWLNQWKWHAVFDNKVGKFYANRSKYIGKINGKRKQKSFKMHRVIINANKGRVVDHINHNTLDNRRINLREVSIRQNAQNHSLEKSKKFSSKYPGVFFEKKRSKWRAKIYINKIKKHVGYFDSEKEAFEAYKKAVHELTGEKVVCEL